MSSSTSSNAAAGRARSCTGCRQVKLACDARRTAPQPCTRCKNKSLQCKFDNNFRRIPMRRVAQEITNGIHRLLPPDATDASASLERGHSAAAESSKPPSSTFSPSSSSQGANANARVSVHPFQGTRSWLNIHENDFHGKYGLGTVELDGDKAVTLFKHFERYYFRHAPFLQNVDSLYDLANRSPILFWTIVLTASREHAAYSYLYEQICVANGVLLSPLTHIAIQTIEEIHALLLLCLWPIPKYRNMYDPAWSYIGLATNSAMQLGCHNPTPPSSITSTWAGQSDLAPANLSLETAALTWIYCFQIGARLAAGHGLPPPLATPSQLRSVKRAVNSISTILTEEQKAANEILRVACLATSEVDFAEDPPTRNSLIHMFDDQFDKISEAYQQYWTPELDIELRASKFYLYGLLLVVQDDASTQTQQHMINRQVILLRAKDAASKFASRMTQLSNTPAEDGAYLAGSLTFYPKHYFNSLYTAVAYLFRFLASYPGVTQQDTTTVVSGLTESHRVFQSFPEHRDAFKAAIGTQALAEIIRDKSAFHPFPLHELAVTNRLGFSIALDVRFRVGLHRNKHMLKGASPSAMSDWVSMNEDPRQPLPPTPEARAIASGTTSSNHDTDDGHEQVQNQMIGPWMNWDNYLSDFLVEGNYDQWSNEMLTHIDPVTQAQMYETSMMTTLQVPGTDQSSRMDL